MIIQAKPVTENSENCCIRIYQCLLDTVIIAPTGVYAINKNEHVIRCLILTMLRVSPSFEINTDNQGNGAIFFHTNA